MVRGVPFSSKIVEGLLRSPAAAKGIQRAGHAGVDAHTGLRAPSSHAAAAHGARGAGARKRDDGALRRVRSAGICGRGAPVGRRPGAGVAVG